MLPASPLPVNRSKWHSSEFYQKFPKFLLVMPNFERFLKHRSSEVPSGQHFFDTQNKAASVAMRNLEPHSLSHNKMVSSFQMLCVIIARPALGFLHTWTNLSTFTKDFRGERQLDEYIGDFSQVLLRRDWPERIEKSLIHARQSGEKAHIHPPGQGFVDPLGIKRLWSQWGISSVLVFATIKWWVTLRHSV